MRQQFRTKPKPTARKALESWCLVEAGFVRGMQPRGQDGPTGAGSCDEDVRNFAMVEKAIGGPGKARMRLMVYHVVDRGFDPSTFRLYDQPIAPSLPSELLPFGITHDQLKTLAWENLVRAVERVIEATPAAPVVATIDEGPAVRTA